MHTIRTFGGSSIAEMLFPPFRVVDYSDSPDVLTVSTLIRKAWVTAPSFFSSNNEPQGDPVDMLGRTIRAIESASAAEFLAARNPDKNTIHTPLRDWIYHMWNHVFWDVSNFLAEAACGTGHFHFPAEGLLVLEYPVDGAATVIEKVWETSVLVAPTFVEEGVKVRFEVGEAKAAAEEAGDEKEGSAIEVKNPLFSEIDSSGITFDATRIEGFYNKTEVCWIKKGERVRIHVGEDYGKDRTGVAAVFVFGKMCDCVPKRANDSNVKDVELSNGKGKMDGEDEEVGTEEK